MYPSGSWAYQCAESVWNTTADFTPWNVTTLKMYSLTDRPGSVSVRLYILMYIVWLVRLPHKSICTDIWCEVSIIAKYDWITESQWHKSIVYVKICGPDSMKKNPWLNKTWMENVSVSNCPTEGNKYSVRGSKLKEHTISTHTMSLLSVPILYMAIVYAQEVCSMDRQTLRLPFKLRALGCTTNLGTLYNQISVQCNIRFFDCTREPIM